MTDPSNQNNRTGELDRPAKHVIGDGFLKAVGALIIAGVVAFAGWMNSMHNSQQELTRKSTEVSFKLDVLTKQLADTKSSARDAEVQARDNARRIDRIEATRFTEADANKALAPLEHRLDQLEERRRR